MTAREKDDIARKIVTEMVNYFEDYSELNWEDLDDEDATETKKKMTSIVKRYILVDNKKEK